MRKFFQFLLCIFLFLPVNAFAQDFHWTQKENGNRSQRVAVIDGETYFVFPEEKGRQLLKDVREFDVLKDKNALLEKKNSLYQERIKIKNDQIDFLQKELSLQTKLTDKFLREEDKTRKKIWETSEFHFALGFLLASGTYTAWEYANSQQK